MPVGRIVLKEISESKKLSLLKTDGARLLYTWLIPHLNVNGCFSADPIVVRGRVFTRLDKSIEDINSYLDDLENNGLIVRYNTDGDDFLIMPNFAEKQPKLNKDREGKVNIPLPTQEQLKSKSGVTPTQVKLNQVKLSKSNATPEQSTPVDNSPMVSETENEKDAFLKELKETILKTADRYNSIQEQSQIESFVKSNIRSGNKRAIIHCINQLTRAPEKVIKLRAYLDSAFKIENGKYNAEDSEIRNNQYKKDDLSGIAGIFKNMSMGRDLCRT